MKLALPSLEAVSKPLVASGFSRTMAVLKPLLVVLLLGVHPAQAQQTTPCRVLCPPEFKVEPTITFTNLFGSPRTIAAGGTPTRERRETEFELILSLGLPTHLSWLDFTVEAIFLPFNADSTPELEFETNFVWLPAQRTGGWLSSHFDVGYVTTECATASAPSAGARAQPLPCLPSFGPRPSFFSGFTPERPTLTTNFLVRAFCFRRERFRPMLSFT
jgi:hypothetical protein